MAAKTIALDPETYELLRRHRRAGETFSDVVRRQLRPPAKISDLAGSLRGVSSAAWKDIERHRRATRRRDLRRDRLTRVAGEPE